MNTMLALVCFTSLFFAITSGQTIQIINVELGGHCGLSAAPVGPGGSWQIVEQNVKKICPAGSSCRRRACNCDNLSDGTVMSISHDSDGKFCRRVAGQKCSSDDECFYGVKCTSGICTCSGSDCTSSKNEATILSR